MQSKDFSKSSKGKTSIYIDKGRIKARLPRQYFSGEQPRISLGMDATESNMAKAHRIAERITLDLQDGCFDESLVKYGIKGNFKLKRSESEPTVNDDTPIKPKLGTLEIYEMYCEYKKSKVQETTYQIEYKGSFLRTVTKAITVVGDDAIKIHNWLLENRYHGNAKKLLSALDKAYQLAIKQGLITHNPFSGLHQDIEINKTNKTHSQSSEIEDDNDVLNKAKCYTWEESLIIREYIKNNKAISHWYHLVSFRFLTGCRPSESYGLLWMDIKWDDECIVIRRSYSSHIKKFKPTKNNKIRLFPMPKNGELWNLLKELPQGEPNEIVFKTQTGKIFNRGLIEQFWEGNKKRRRKGIPYKLIEQGKLKNYHPFYNCRHTFITHQIFDLGREPEIVNSWCEHSDAVSRKHYRDTHTHAMTHNPELPANHNQQKTEIELLKQQNELLMKQLEELKKQNNK